MIFHGIIMISMAVLLDLGFRECAAGAFPFRRGDAVQSLQPLTILPDGVVLAGTVTLLLPAIRCLGSDLVRQKITERTNLERKVEKSANLEWRCPKKFLHL